MIGMDAATGRAISGKDHLAQSIADVLTTPIGTRVMRRNYGSLIPDLIDHPLHGANVLRLYAATAHALLLWEPRIRVTDIQLQISMEGTVELELGCIANGKELQLSIPVKS